MTEVDHTFWYLTRASGFVAYLLLSLSLVLGLTMTGDLLGRRVSRFRIYDLHRFVSLLALCVTLFHVFIVLPDDYIGFSLAELLLPLASPYEPGFMAAGLLAFYLLGLIVLSFYLLRFVGYGAWRLLHYTTFAVFGLALAHAAGAGSDSDLAWARYLYAATALVAFNLVVYRALRGSARGPAPRGQRLPSGEQLVSRR